MLHLFIRVKNGENLIHGFRDTCSSVEKVRLVVCHAQRRVQNYDIVNNMAAHSILFIRPLICVNIYVFMNLNTFNNYVIESNVTISRKVNELRTLNLEVLYHSC